MKWVYFLLLLGCSSSPIHQDSILVQSHRPPSSAFLPFDISTKDPASIELYLLKELAQNPTPAMKWWVEYQQAKIWADSAPKKSCDHFTSLSQNKEFPLKELALIYAHQICESSSHLDPIYPISLFKEISWLKELATRVGLNKTRREGDWWHQMHLAIEQSRFVSDQQAKIDLIQEALMIARLHGDPRFVREFENRLYKVAPRLRPQPSEKYYSAIAYDYRRVRDFDSARKYYHKIAAHVSNVDQVFQALKGIATTYKLEREMTLFLEATDEAALYIKKNFKNNKKQQILALHHEAQIMKARAHWTEGKSSYAKQILNELLLDLKDRYPLHQIYILMSRIYEEEKKYPEALLWLKKAEFHASKPLLEQINWFKAWNHRKLKEYDKAIALLIDLKNNQHDPSEKSRYGFWLARTYKDQGSKVEALAEYERVLQSDPMGYYGLLSHRELELDLNHSIPKSDKNNEKNLPNNLSLQHVTAEEQLQLLWLISLNEKELSTPLLSTISQRYKENPSIQHKDWQTLIEYFANAEDYIGLYNQLSALNLDQKIEFYQSRPDALFPRPYREVVDAAANRFGVHPELIYAIMRQESAFNPKARSPADAFGLLQIIPKVAHESALKAKIEVNKDSDLFDPKINISLGSLYIRELWDKYHGQFILTVASYNASEKALQNWVRSRFNGDPVEFIEDIPYKETQDYVKRVLRNLIFYQKIQAGDKSIPFPEWCLENIQGFNS